MTNRIDLSPQERYDIVAYRIECAEKTLGEIDNLLALKYNNNATNRMYYACYYAVSPKAKELVAVVKEKVDQWLAENKA